MAVNYGSKRLVVGAHYGTRDWLAQRVTAILMTVYTFIVLGRWAWPRYVLDEMGERVLNAEGQALVVSGYDKWAGVFAPGWVKFLTFAVAVALIYHVWVGVRNVLMDYVKADGLRLSLQIAALVYLAGCAGWILQVLWSI